MSKNNTEMSNLFVRVFNSVLSWEEQSFREMKFKDLTLREVHILEAVFGLAEDGKNRMSEIAKYLSITPGSLTVSVNGLVEKGYLDRRSKQGDRRVVMIVPTAKAEEVNKIRSEFRNGMISEIIDISQPCDREVIYKTLCKVNEYFEKKKNARG